MPRQCWQWLGNQDWESNKRTGKNLLRCRHGAGALLPPPSTLRVLPQPHFGVRSRHHSSPSLIPPTLHSHSHTMSPFPTYAQASGRAAKEQGLSDSRAALPQAPCVASSHHVTVSPQKITSLPPRGLGGRKQQQPQRVKLLQPSVQAGCQL